MWSKSVELFNPYEALMASKATQPTQNKKTSIWSRFRKFLGGI